MIVVTRSTKPPPEKGFLGKLFQTKSPPSGSLKSSIPGKILVMKD
jgi:hypothetical protein